MPLLIFLAVYLRGKGQKPAALVFFFFSSKKLIKLKLIKKIIKKIPREKFKKEEFTEDECSICIMKYNENDLVLRLPCNTKLIFNLKENIIN